MSSANTSNPTRQLVSAALVAVVSIVPGVSWAEDIAIAEALFDKGLADMEAGKYDTGCPAIAESQRLDPRPGTLFTLAECEAKAGRIATAVARYEDYLQVFLRLPPNKQQQQLGRDRIATAQKQALAPEVPYLTLVPPPDAPKGMHVLRDGVYLDSPALGVALPVDPGEHVVTVEAPGLHPSEQRISLAKRDRKTLQLAVGAPIAAASAAASLSSPAPSPGRIGAYVIVGVGLAGIAIGAVTGGLVFADKNIIDQNCKGIDCNRRGFDAVNEARALGIVSTISFIVGGTGLAAGATLLVTEPKVQSKKGAADPRIAVGLAANAQGIWARVQGGW